MVRPQLHSMKGGKMKKQKKSILVLAVMVVFIFTGLFLPGLVVAGDLGPPAAPTEDASAMYTLEDIYNRLNENTIATKRTGGFTEPPPGPISSTGHTMDQIYDLAIPTQVEKTGQTTSSLGRDDGALKMGVTWPNPRFKNNGNGTTTDNLTELIWLQNADCFGEKNWADALTASNGLSNGSCDLTDGSSAGDWRLPNVKELLSLIDYGVWTPALPNNGLLFFYDVQTDDNYWSSTRHATSATNAWFVYMNHGTTSYEGVAIINHVWCVRDVD